jgi:predicted O-methyltransferase YrrM
MGIKIKAGQALNKFLNKFDLEIIRTHPKEAIKFAKRYFQGKEIIAAEIGVFFGKNSREINKNLRVKRLYLIDPYLNNENYKNDGNYKKLKRARENAHRINNFRNNIWIEELSENAVKKIKEDLDFLYIDGSHEYEYVKKDLQLYWPKIKRGGIVSGHDIQGNGVSKAVLEFANKNKVDVHFGDRRDWWIEKK